MSTGKYTAHRGLIELLIRLLGLYFVVDGGVGLIGHGIELLDLMRVTPYAFENGGGYVLAWIIANLAQLLAGLALIFRTGIALDMILHDQSDSNHDL